MTKVQMHIFNWFFLFIMAIVSALHVVVAHFRGVPVGPGLYILLLIFLVIWLVIYLIQMMSFGTKKGNIGLVVNGLLTGFWVIVYAFINAA